MKAKLFFNPAAGNPAESAGQLVELLHQLQAQHIEPEVLLVQPDMRLDSIAQKAVRAGVKLVIVSGGDSTIENVALGLVGSRTILGIIPTGSRNNLARSLGIPIGDLAAAAALVRHGRRVRIDIGHARHRKGSRFFLEAGAVGLASALYSSADDIQHGNLGKIGEFLSTLVAAEPSEIRLRLDHHRAEIVAHAHLVLVANMPFMGANFQIGPDVSFDDRHFDVLVYSDFTKRDLIGHVIQLVAAAPDTRVQRYRAKSIAITTKPAMPVMADGVLLGDGPVTVTLRPRSLAVMAGEAETVKATA